MSILAIDTSAPIAYVALKANSGQIHEAQADNQHSHNESIANLVSSVVKSAQSQISDIKLILLGRGPGSFTGLRIGYSFTLGLALANKAEVIEVSSLLSCAALETKFSLIAAVSDARRSEVFFGLYLRDANRLSILESEKIVAIAEVSIILEEYRAKLGYSKSDCVVTGFSEELKACVPSLNLASGILAAYESPNLVDKRAKPLSDLAPNYLRAVSAKTIAERSAGVPVASKDTD